MLKNINIEKEITKESINGGNWLDDVTYVCYISMSDKLQELLGDIIDHSRVDLMAEYWEDEKSYHYILMFEDDNVVINDKIECEYLNNLLLEHSKIV